MAYSTTNSPIQYMSWWWWWWRQKHQNYSNWSCFEHLQDNLRSITISDIFFEITLEGRPGCLQSKSFILITQLEKKDAQSVAVIDKWKMFSWPSSSSFSTICHPINSWKKLEHSGILGKTHPSIVSRLNNR